MNLSTIIPVYIENPYQLELLNRTLDSISQQSFHPIEVIVSDNSAGGIWAQKVKEMAQSKTINVKYFANLNLFGPANNTNYAAGIAKAELIHILHQDDFVLNKKLYEEVSEVFSQEKNIWLIAQGKVGERVLNSKFDFTTKFGFNELGGPSGLFVLKQNYISFNPKYRMLFDVINYHEYYLKMGEPYILKGVNIHFHVHEYQLSNKITSKEVLLELSDFIEEYGIPSSEIKRTVKSIKREIHHQRVLLKASMLRKKISIYFFIVYMCLSFLKALKRKILN